MSSPNYSPIDFTGLISKYQTLQSNVGAKIESIAKNPSAASPGQFLLVQFQLAQTTQIGDSISNMMQQMNSIIAGAIRNFKG